MRQGAAAVQHTQNHAASIQMLRAVVFCLVGRLHLNQPQAACEGGSLTLVSL